MAFPDEHDSRASQFQPSILPGGPPRRSVPPFVPGLRIPGHMNREAWHGSIAGLGAPRAGATNTRADRDAQGTLDADRRPRAQRLAACRDRNSSATSSTTPSPIRATARRCSPRRAPAISGRRSFARRTAGARGRKRGGRRRSARTAAASSTTRSGSRRVTRASRGVWYAGTSPQGLFRSDDGGATWEGVDGFNAHPQRKAWCGGDQDGTPDGPKLHSILIDPRDAAHMYIGMSSGGVFESPDAGERLAAAQQGREG